MVVVTVTVRHALVSLQVAPIPCVTSTVYQDGSPSAGVVVVTHIRGDACCVFVMGLLLLFALNGLFGRVVPVTIIVSPGPGGL
jgi:hypothetical protein